MRATPELKCLNLGAGVQSTTLALMAARGELPDGELPDFAVFADTGWEPTAVYQHLQRKEYKIGALPSATLSRLSWGWRRGSARVAGWSSAG